MVVSFGIIARCGRWATVPPGGRSGIPEHPNGASLHLAALPYCATPRQYDMMMMLDILQRSLMVTGFVFTMMLVIEYVNVVSKGRWERVIGKQRGLQRSFSALLGATPGCLGAYAVVSLYMHRVITSGALVAAMIATCGDEAFVMLALFPRQALLLFAILFGLGLLGGLLTDLVLGGRKTHRVEHPDGTTGSHGPDIRCVPFSAREFLTQWRNCSAQRGWLALFLSLFLVGVLSGKLGHDHALPGVDAPEAHLVEGAEACEDPAHEHAGAHDDHAEHAGHAEETGAPWDWIRVTMLLSGLVGLFIVISVPDHFLEDHLWRHIARVHISRIFLWTVGALLLVDLLLSHAHVADIITDNPFSMLAIACLLGLIPESGPHLIFVTLYAQGAAPFAILLASSIAQDGHGMIPLLAHSRRAFIAVKAGKAILAFLIGLAVLLLD